VLKSRASTWIIAAEGGCGGRRGCRIPGAVAAAAVDAVVSSDEGGACRSVKPCCSAATTLA